MAYNYQGKKTVVVLANTLTPGVALNVLGHLATSLGAHCDDAGLMGRSTLLDASGVLHRGISKYPLIITQVKPGTVRKAVAKARQNPNLFLADYPKQMLNTGHDDELAASLAQSAEDTLEYLGVLLYGPSADVDEITGKFSLWR